MQDAIELAALVLGHDPDNFDEDAIDNELIDRFDVDYSQWETIVLALLPFTIPAKAALSGKTYHGFVVDGRFVLCSEAIVPGQSGKGES